MSVADGIGQRELNLAKQQSQDLARTKQCIEGMLNGELKAAAKEAKLASEKQDRTSPTKTKADIKAQFSEPPAPPPQQPLPEKPDVAQALADPVIQPLLLRSSTARPPSFGNNSPTRSDHSHALLILAHELKLAKGQIPSLEDRVKNLENELQAERTARESAEERAQKLESNVQHESTESPNENEAASDAVTEEPEQDDRQASEPTISVPDLQAQLERLRASMDDMKQQMEAYRRRAEVAESERDEVRQSLAEMIEQKRKENAELESKRSPSRRRRSSASAGVDSVQEGQTNGHVVVPKFDSEVAVATLLEKAGVESNGSITKEQAATLMRLLGQEVLGPQDGGANGTPQLSYYGIPTAWAVMAVAIGITIMQIGNGEWKIR